MLERYRLPATPFRSLYLLDVMAVVAATAGGLALARVCWEETANNRYHGGSALAMIRPSEILLDWPLSISVPFFAAGAWPIASSWTLALIALRLCRPGPKIDPIARRPGMAASVAAASIILLMCLLLPLFFRAQGYRGNILVFMASTRLTYELPPLVGASVAGAWLTLIWNGHFRPERSWLGWTGRVVEAGWIVLGVLALWANLESNTAGSF